jgi:RNA polymerase II subunit A small phosphatase-like protein
MSAATEVAPVQQRSHAAAAWRVVAGWLGLLFQILLRIIRGTPSSWPQLLSFVGLRHPLLPVAASPEVAFVQLPSEAPADALPPPLRRLTVRTSMPSACWNAK